ncbi:HNH endonuclease signature motif containing protein [Desulfitobacterium sp. PCE1]|uniref:HNH endonuclease signature motif containing protein n=1 Tax=Desulfitobacterium sp. PCE1 TaxID=146907 RepID=UPI0003A9EEC1|nr:HNH endonuclease signature motif containing protein [Desulfitobacterium sp. PCE1]
MCICREPFVEIHHIIPQEEGGPDTLDNAAPLCSSCHDLYGGNPYKRKQIKQMRDYWFELVENTIMTNDGALLEIEKDPYFLNSLKNKGIALYHVVFENESFEESAQMIFEIVRTAQKTQPNLNRALYLDIDGHRNENGGYDNDMFELQRHFILGYLLPFLSEIHIPLCSAKNTKLQKNNIPDELNIFSSDEEMIKHLKKEGKEKSFTIYSEEESGV